MLKKSLIIPIFLLALLLIVSLACGTSNEGTIITPGAQEAEQAEGPAPDEAESPE